MDHQLIGVLFLSLSHLYLFLLFLNLWLLSDVCLSVCLSVSIFCLSVYKSVEVCLAIQFSFYLSIHLTICPSIFLSICLFCLSDHWSVWLSVFGYVCLICLSVHLSILGSLKSKYKIKAIFYMLFSKAFMSKKIYQKNIKIGKRKLRHKMIKQEIVWI